MESFLKLEVVPIPGTRNMDHLNENLDAIAVQLSESDLTDIEAAFAKVTVHGGRMNEMQMTFVEN
jgi:aryl-alcohol dehydrogenase-like predicted oxidoreductase